MNLSTLKALVSFNRWFWLSFGGTVLSFVFSSIFSFLSPLVNDDAGYFALGALFFIVNIGDLVLFILNVRKGAIFDWGFNISILLPTVSFYVIIVLILVDIIKMSSHGLASRSGQAATKIFIFLLFLLKITYSLAFASPGGVIISALSFIVYIILLLTWPKFVEKPGIHAKTQQGETVSAPEHEKIE